MIIKNRQTRNGDQRSRHFYTLWPIRLDNDTFVWLEWVTISETYRSDNSGRRWMPFMVLRGIQPSKTYLVHD